MIQMFQTTNQILMISSQVSINKDCKLSSPLQSLWTTWRLLYHFGCRGLAPTRATGCHKPTINEGLKSQMMEWA